MSVRVSDEGTRSRVVTHFEIQMSKSWRPGRQNGNPGSKPPRGSLPVRRLWRRRIITCFWVRLIPAGVSSMEQTLGSARRYHWVSELKHLGAPSCGSHENDRKLKT